MTPSPLVISAAQPEDLATIRVLLGEYANWLATTTGADMESVHTEPVFARLAQEIQGLPGEYQPPDGALLMARLDEQPAGMVALRRLDAHRCEMKRLYVRAAARGAGVGRQLAEHVIAAARIRGYRDMLLDTLPEMPDAQRLYIALGFRDITPYYESPLPGTRYMALQL